MPIQPSGRPPGGSPSVRFRRSTNSNNRKPIEYDRPRQPRLARTSSKRAGYSNLQAVELSTNAANERRPQQRKKKNGNRNNDKIKGNRRNNKEAEEAIAHVDALPGFTRHQEKSSNKIKNCVALRDEHKQAQSVKKIWMVLQSTDEWNLHQQKILHRRRSKKPMNCDELCKAAAKAYERAVAAIQGVRRVCRTVRFRGIGGMFFTRLGPSPLAAWEMEHLDKSRIKQQGENAGSHSLHQQQFSQRKPATQHCGRHRGTSTHCRDRRVVVRRGPKDLEFQELVRCSTWWRRPDSNLWLDYVRRSTRWRPSQRACVYELFGTGAQVYRTKIDCCLRVTNSSGM